MGGWVGGWVGYLDEIGIIHKFAAVFLRYGENEANVGADLGGWVGGWSNDLCWILFSGWVGGWVEEIEAVGMRCCE